MNRITLFGLALSVGLCGCHSFRDDVAAICDSPDKIGDTSKMRPTEKLTLIDAYLQENVKSKEGRKFVTALTATPRGARSKMLRDQALSMDIPVCHFADMP
jgi:hypothetical protein